MMKLFWYYTVVMVVLPYEYTKNTELYIWKGCILWYESTPQLNKTTQDLSTQCTHCYWGIIAWRLCPSQRQPWEIGVCIPQLSIHMCTH